MRRTFAIGLIAVVAAVLFAALVHAVLVAAHVSEPADTTVYGVTLRRLWASAAAALALGGVGAGVLAVVRPTSRVQASGQRLAAIVAAAAGVAAMLNGGLNLAVATGGPGTGNGVVGAAAAIVLGLIALAMGALALTSHRHAASGAEPTT